MALGNLDLSETIIADTEEFTCYIYGYPKNKCLSDVLKAEFDKKCNAKPGKNSLDCIKSMDPTTLTPRSKVLMQQIKQTFYVTYLYSKAYSAYSALNLFPIDYGYKLLEIRESLNTHWFGDKFRFLRKF